MKIGIITQPMAANYGCNLQAYALQVTLERLGHEVRILDRWSERNNEGIYVLILKRMIRFAKDTLKFILRKSIYHTIEESDRAYYWQHFLCFQREYLHLTDKFRSSAEIKAYTDNCHFDAYVVGSDQVWRPAYNLGEKLYDMYLAFAKDQDVKRISYAASFGVDNWEYTKEQTNRCSELIKRFDAVSVREKSGVDLCKNSLGVKAINVLDPTMLLDVKDYNFLIERKLQGKTEGELFCYILDSSPAMLGAMDFVEKISGLKRFTCLPLVPENTYDVFDKAGSILPSPEEWLRCFRDAKMVLVDSFHGMVFSIIYNKPFWVVGNPKRGMTRFKSLLSLFGLEERLVTVEQLSSINLNSPIDWQKVNERYRYYKTASKNFINHELS